MIQFQRFKQSDSFYTAFYIFNNLICFILPSVRPSVCPICLSIYLSIYLSTHPTIHPSIFVSFYSAFCPSIQFCLSIILCLSIYLFVCLPILSNLHFRIDFGRNDPGPKRPRAESTHLHRPKQPTPKLGPNDPGRNNPGRNDPGPKRPGFLCKWRQNIAMTFLFRIS